MNATKQDPSSGWEVPRAAKARRRKVPTELWDTGATSACEAPLNARARMRAEIFILELKPCYVRVKSC